MNMQTKPASTAPIGYQQITTLSSATPLAAPANARWALIVPESKDVRWRDDGANPTAAIGMPIAAGQAFEYTGDLSAIKFIEQAASAKLNVAYYD